MDLIGWSRSTSPPLPRPDLDEALPKPGQTCHRVVPTSQGRSTLPPDEARLAQHQIRPTTAAHPAAAAKQRRHAPPPSAMRPSSPSVLLWRRLEIRRREGSGWRMLGLPPCRATHGRFCFSRIDEIQKQRYLSHGGWTSESHAYLKQSYNHFYIYFKH